MIAAARNIAVLRALQLGDLLCVVPALRALRAAAPAAKITLIGLPWAQQFVERFPGYLDAHLSFPGFPGFPEQATDPARFTEFLSLAQQCRFDLVLQMQGSGTLSNSLTVLLGAQSCAGFYPLGAYCPDLERFLPWIAREHEILRYLRLMRFIGADGQGDELEFPLRDSDRAALENCRLPPGTRYACLHPGARMGSRRWMPQRFAAVADCLYARGLRIVLTGTAAERPLTAAVADAMLAPAHDLSGKTSLGALAALIADARLVVSNDTAVSHLAAALATPSVIVSCGSDPGRWAPLDRQRHRTLHQPMACRPCSYADCPIGHPCAGMIDVDAVVRQADELLQ